VLNAAKEQTMKGATAWSEAITAMPKDEQLITLAIAVLQNRIDALPEDDRNELFELALELRRAEDAEESQSIWAAMREVLAQRPMTARRLPTPERPAPAGRAKKWAQATGNRIRQLRAERDWTQTELAERAGLPQSHICRIERAEYTATNKTLQKIAKAFGVELTQIDPSGE
jgi:DNA-binding XRE family transcriptional regulator